jgi:hypothetical protein
MHGSSGNIRNSQGITSQGKSSISLSVKSDFSLHNNPVLLRRSYRNDSTPQASNVGSFAQQFSQTIEELGFGESVGSEKEIVVPLMQGIIKTMTFQQKVTQHHRMVMLL